MDHFNRSQKDGGWVWLVRMREFGEDGGLVGDELIPLPNGLPGMELPHRPKCRTDMKRRSSRGFSENFLLLHVR